LSDTLLYLAGVRYSRSVGKAADEEQRMYLQRAVRQALRLGLLVTLVVLALSACGGGDGEEQAEPRPLPEEEQTLRPGVYRSEEFAPSLSFRVGKGWSTSPPELSDHLQITRGHTMGGMGFANAQEVYKPTETGTPEVVKAPEDMVEWFQQHPYLRTSELEPVMVGGVEGEQCDLVLGDLPEDYLGVCGGECVPTLRFSDGSWLAFPKGAKARLIVLEDVKGETLVMGFASPTTEFAEHASEAQKVIDTVQWRGS
jgi:hypothetical protein